MLRPFKFLSREVRGMHQAAYLLAGFALASQLLGIVRTRIFASSFGAGHTLDLFYAAFQVPDFLFATVASLFSLYALLPILSKLESEKEGLMVAFLWDMLWVFFAGMSVVAMATYILAPAVVPLMAPGLVHDPKSYAELVLLVRILLLQPILLGASNTIAALTQLRHRFVLYSISPLLYNLGIISGALFLYPRWGIAGLAWGVVFGAVLHVGVQLPFFLSERPQVSVTVPRLLKGLREVLLLSVPRTLSLASTQISYITLTAIASLLSPGSIVIFNWANVLQSVPLSIIGVSYSVAAFPTLAKMHAAGERAEFTQYVEAAMRHVIFWSIPATAFIIVLRAQLVRVIIGAGPVDWAATRLTAAALALFVLSLGAQSLTLLISRAYYATGNTKKPLYFGIADIAVSISSAFLLAGIFNANAGLRSFVEALLRVDDVRGTTVLMLALGYALGSISEFAIGASFFLRDFSIERKGLWRLALECFGASVIGSACSYGVLYLTGLPGQVNTVVALMSQGFVAGALGLAVTGAILYALKNREFGEALASVKRRFKDIRPVAVEPSDVS